MVAIPSEGSKRDAGLERVQKRSWVPFDPSKPRKHHGRALLLDGLHPLGDAPAVDLGATGKLNLRAPSLVRMALQEIPSVSRHLATLY